MARAQAPILGSLRLDDFGLLAILIRRLLLATSDH